MNNDNKDLNNLNNIFKDFKADEDLSQNHQHNKKPKKNNEDKFQKIIKYLKEKYQKLCLSSNSKEQNKPDNQSDELSKTIPDKARSISLKDLNLKDLPNTLRNITLKGVIKKLSSWFTIFGLKSLIALVAIFAILFIYFDSVIKSGFDVNDKWILPAVVYSRPLELYADQRLSLDQMIYELKLLKYRESNNPSRPGEYYVNKNNSKVLIFKRAFDFPEGPEPALPILVDFNNSRVTKITKADDMSDLSYVRMDPVLLDRINRIDPREDRIFITIDDAPQMLKTALIDVEDRSFYSNMGVNFFAIIRATIKNTLAGHVVEGGSTITQQLVKNYFLNSERSYIRKFKEIIMAIIMNHRYTKDQILEAYMNEIYLGQNGNAGIYGFGLASYFYFGIPVNELSLDQIALLVGIIKGPSYYDPWRKPQNAINRRNVVLGVLLDQGRITQEQYDYYTKLPLNVIKRGSMNYSKTPAFMGLLKLEIAKNFGDDFLSGNGIKIFTSLDPQAQKAAEEAVYNKLNDLEKQTGLKGLEAAMVVSNWRTAEVAAVVGSRQPNYDGFNRVIGARRQIGSQIKPFVYLTALASNKYQLGSIVKDTPLTVKLSDGKYWSPSNDDNQFRGDVTVIGAMSKSLNVPTVRIGMGVGIYNVVKTIQSLGLSDSIISTNRLYPSLLLGVSELTPYELNSLYASFATNGVYKQLTSLRTIIKDGQIVYQRADDRESSVIDPKDKYLTLYGMIEATKSGTGKRIGAMFPNTNIATKTGTTNNNRDTWATGIDAEEVVTTWVGNDDNKSTKLYGSSGALVVYADYLKRRGVNSLDMSKPNGIKFVNFSTDGQILDDGCTEPGMRLLPVKTQNITNVKKCSGVQQFDAISNLIDKLTP